MTERVTERATSWESLLRWPCVIIITGKRGSGKTALAYYLLEKLYGMERGRVGVLGLSQSQLHLLPGYFHAYSELSELPADVVVLIDEAAQHFHARRSQATQSLMMDNLIGLSRQRNQVIVFVSHHTRKLDINILTEADMVVFKEPSSLYLRFERPEVRSMVAEVKEFFKLYPETERQRYSVVFSNTADTMYTVENPLPSFWSEELSKLWREVDMVELGRPTRRTGRSSRIFEEAEPSGTQVSAFWEAFHSSKPYNPQEELLAKQIVEGLSLIGKEPMGIKERRQWARALSAVGVTTNIEVTPARLIVVWPESATHTAAKTYSEVLQGLKTLESRGKGK